MKDFYIKNIDRDTLGNDNFRNVIFTGEHLQLVLMNLKPGEDIGGEVHSSVDQFFRIESGSGKAVIEGVDYEFSEDFGIVIPAGVEHNIINTGDKPLKLYSIYAPPQHKEDTIEPVKTVESEILNKNKNKIMKNLLKFEEFLNEAAISKDYSGAPQLTHWYTGNPSLEMPLKDLLEALRIHFKMSKKEFPSNKPEFNRFKRGGGEVETPDGFTIYWSKSTPPNVYLTIKRKDGDEKQIEYIQGVINDILAEYSVPINKSVQDAWDRIPEDVKVVLESAWSPAIEARQIMTVLDDNRIKFDYASSRFDKRKLPRGFEYIEDPKTTNFSVKTPKRTVLFEIHRTSTWTIVSW